jgi:hypothetical protein
MHVTKFKQYKVKVKFSEFEGNGPAIRIFEIFYVRRK